MLLLNQVQRDDSFTQSSNLVMGQLQVGDSVLGQVVQQLTQVVSLATRANNGTLNASDVKSISNQIAGIRGEVLGLANTNYQGQYVFAGGETASVPFTLSSGVASDTVTYNGDQGVNYVQTPNGQKIQLNIPGDQIFSGSGSNNVFAALNSLIADYSSGTVDTAQAANDSHALSSALNYVSEQRVSLDNSITQLTAATDAVSSEQTQVVAAQTNLMQADVATVATQLALAKAQQTALQSVIAQLGAGSLFDKL